MFSIVKEIIYDFVCIHISLFDLNIDLNRALLILDIPKRRYPLFLSDMVFFQSMRSLWQLKAYHYFLFFFKFPLTITNSQCMDVMFFI